MLQSEFFFKNGLRMSSEFEQPEIYEDVYDVFPELVWLKISSKIQETHDWLNLYFTSPTLMDLLQNEMIERLFPKVFPHIYKYLRRYDVMKLYAIDRKFEAVITSWVQSRYSESVDYEEYFDDEYYGCFKHFLTWKYTPVFTIRSPKHVEEITREFKNLEDYGFGFMIHFGITFVQYYKEDLHFWSAAKYFIKKFGMRMLMCKLQYYQRKSFSNIILSLKLMPNLVRLELDLSHVLVPLNHPKKFPHLVNLKVLSMFFRKPVNFVEFLRTHTDQLESLYIYGEHKMEENFSCSKLKLLCVMMIKEDSRATRLHQFSLSPMLKTIETEVYSPSGFTEFGRRFLQLNMFGASLEELVLHARLYIDMTDFQYNEENDMTWVTSIHLPKLKKLKFSNAENGERFVLAIPSFHNPNISISLESITWDRCSRKKGKRIKEVFDSEIWYILPNLEELIFCDLRDDEIYTREEYNEHHKRLRGE